MNKIFALVALCCMLLPVTLNAQQPAEAPTAATPSAELQLNSQVDFGPYSIAAPSGMMGQTPAPNQYIFMMRPAVYSIVAFIAEGKPKNLKEVATEALRSLHFTSYTLKEIKSDGMKGYTASQRLEDKIVTYALLLDGNQMLTIIITERESLQPLGPQSISTLSKSK